MKIETSTQQKPRNTKYWQQTTRKQERERDKLSLTIYYPSKVIILWNWIQVSLDSETIYFCYLIYDPYRKLFFRSLVHMSTTRVCDYWQAFTAVWQHHSKKKCLLKNKKKMQKQMQAVQWKSVLPIISFVPESFRLKLNV